MEKETTADRLKQIMKENNLKQVDILKLTESLCEEYDVKMNKSDISQYVAGKVEPNQQKLFVLGKALNVSEAWLMGYDAPKERNGSYNENEPTKLSPEHQQLITALNRAEFARKYNIPYRTIEDWEKGKSVWAPYVAELLEKVVRADLEIIVQ